MKIAGLSKLTLLDYPNHLAAIVFTAGCNLACPFCHNSDLLTADGNLMQESEVLEFLSKRKSILEGLVISGGEPLLQSGLIDFCTKVKQLGYKIKLDTNGFFPKKLDEILSKNLIDYVALDIKNSKEKYSMTTGASVPNQYQTVLESFDIITNSKVDYELRTTLVAGHHTPSDFDQIGKDFAKAKRYFLQTFVDSGHVLTKGLSPLTPDQTKEILFCLQKHIPCAGLR